MVVSEHNLVVNDNSYEILISHPYHDEKEQTVLELSLIVIGYGSHTHSRPS